MEREGKGVGGVRGGVVEREAKGGGGGREDDQEG